MKKSSTSSLKKKKRSPDISLQHKNKASYKFSKKNLLHLAEKRAGTERVKIFLCSIKTKVPIKFPQKIFFSIENRTIAEKVNKLA